MRILLALLLLSPFFSEAQQPPQKPQGPGGGRPQIPRIEGKGLPKVEAGKVPMTPKEGIPGKGMGEPGRTPAIFRQEIPGKQNVPQAGNIPKEIPAKVQEFLQKSKVTIPQQPSRGVGTPAQMPKKTQISPQVHAQIVNRNPQMQNWFNNQFFTRHRFFPPFFNQGGFWWRRNNWWWWNNFFGWGWGYPVYYANTGPVVITPPPVYNQYNTTVYQQLPITQEEQPSQAPAATEEWSSLGVFAVGRTATDVAYSMQFFQLAVNKDGTIAGTYYNSSTDKTHPLGGAVDKDSQQAVWTVTDDPQAPVFTTGLYNLTEDVVNIQASFPSGETQNWVMVPINLNEES